MSALPNPSALILILAIFPEITFLSSLSISVLPQMASNVKRKQCGGSRCPKPEMTLISDLLSPSLCEVLKYDGHPVEP